jgi:hypothetical protein
MCNCRKPTSRNTRFGRSKLVKKKLPIPPELDIKQDKLIPPIPSPYAVHSS